MENLEDLIRYHTKQFFSKMTGSEIDDSKKAVCFSGDSISAVMDITSKNESKGFIGITMPRSLAREVYAAMLGEDGVSDDSDPVSAVKEVLNIIAGRIVTSVQKELPGAVFGLPREVSEMPESDDGDYMPDMIPFFLGEENFFMEFGLSSAREAV